MTSGHAYGTADENGNYRDAVFATDSYDRERAHEAFRQLSSRGYDTARIYFDTCGVGRSCIGIPETAACSRQAQAEAPDGGRRRRPHRPAATGRHRI